MYKNPRYVPGTETSPVPKCPGTEMSLGPKCPGTEMSRYRNVHGTEMSWCRNVSGAEMSRGRNVPGTEMSLYRNVSGTEMSVPKCLMPKSLGPKCETAIKASGSSKILQVLNFMLKESIGKKELHYITKPAVIIDPSQG